MWNYVFYAVVALFVYVSIPKPRNQSRPGIGDITVPTADSTRDLSVIFGTVDIKAPNIPWYGDLRTEAIRVKP